MTIRAFAFDLDETLSDVEHHHGEATRAVFTARGLRASAFTSVLADVTGRRTRDIVDALRVAAGMEDALEDVLMERHHAFRKALERTPPTPLPGALEVLEAAAAAGPVALVTNGFREDALATLEALGVHERFTTYVTGEDVVNPKPHPEPYARAASKLGVPPGEMLAFEDSVRGAKSARAAGCPVIATPNPRNTLPEAIAPHATVLLKSLQDALPFDAFIAKLDAQ